MTSARLRRCADDARENLLTVLAPPDMLGEFRNRGWIRVDGKSVLISDSERLALRAH